MEESKAKEAAAVEMLMKKAVSMKIYANAIGSDLKPIGLPALEGFEKKLIEANQYGRELFKVFTELDETINTRLIWGYIRTICIMKGNTTYADMADAHAVIGRDVHILRTLLLNCTADEACRILYIVGVHTVKGKVEDFISFSSFKKLCGGNKAIYERLNASFLLPTANYCTDEFIEQIVNGKKRLITRKTVLAQAMPHLPELSLPTLLDLWGFSPEMAIVLPDKYPGTVSCNWAYFWDVFNTVYKGTATHLLSQIKKVRKEIGFSDVHKPGNALVANIVANGSFEPKLSLKGNPAPYNVFSKSGVFTFKISSAGATFGVGDECTSAESPPPKMIALLEGPEHL
jgi:hypothetical protein